MPFPGLQEHRNGLENPGQSSTWTGQEKLSYSPARVSVLQGDPRTNNVRLALEAVRLTLMPPGGHRADDRHSAKASPLIQRRPLSLQVSAVPRLCPVERGQESSGTILRDVDHGAPELAVHVHEASDVASPDNVLVRSIDGLLCQSVVFRRDILVMSPADPRGKRRRARGTDRRWWQGSCRDTAAVPLCRSRCRCGRGWRDRVPRDAYCVVAARRTLVWRVFRSWVISGMFNALASC